MPPSDWTDGRTDSRSNLVFPLHFEDLVMPDAKGVEGPQPRPSLLRAAAARRPVRKPGEAAPASGSGAVAAPPPRPSPPAPRRDRRRRNRRPQATAPNAPTARAARPHRLGRPARRPLPHAHAEALQARGKGGHPRTHRHEPGAAHRRHRPPADRARRGRSRLRHARSAARRLRLPPQPGPQLPRQPGRHLRLAVARSAA